MAVNESMITLIGSVAVIIIGALSAAIVQVIRAQSEARLALAHISAKQDENSSKLASIHDDTTDAGKQNMQILSQTNGHLKDLTDRLAEQTKHSTALQSALDSVLEVMRVQNLTHAAAIVSPAREVRATDKPATNGKKEGP
jgi:hypothetical protein